MFKKRTSGCDFWSLKFQANFLITKVLKSILTQKKTMLS
jgi:hypothetical protein